MDVEAVSEDGFAAICTGGIVLGGGALATVLLIMIGGS